MEKKLKEMKRKHNAQLTFIEKHAVLHNHSHMVWWMGMRNSTFNMDKSHIHTHTQNLQ